MTAVIVRFKKPSEITAKSATTFTGKEELSLPTEVATETKKRPASPIPIATEGNISAGEETVADSKRLKSEAV